MGQARNWTAEEFEYLRDKWGQSSLSAIAKKLNRSENAIKIKVQRLGLGAFLEAGEYITFNQFLHAIGKGGGYSYKAISWIKNRGFPVKYKTVNNNRFKVVYFDEFWKWAEKYKCFIDWSLFEENVLGKEPDWVKQQRKIGQKTALLFRTTPWTTDEDNLLKSLLKQYKYGYAELSSRLCRTTGAIQRRIIDLKLKERPVKADNHIKWTVEEYSFLADMIKQGYTYELMAIELCKSTKALRGRVYSLYGSENLDKVRSFMLEGVGDIKRST